MKKYKGITLIALIITIVILLILSGITIASLTQTGLFTKAKEAKEKTICSQAEEKVKLAVNASFDSTASLNKEMLKENLNKIEGINPKVEIVTYDLTVTVDGYQFLISEVGKVTAASNSNDLEEKKISRYMIIEVNGYLENEDGAVINEIEIYDKYNNKINYNILNSLAFDATTNSYPYYWTDNRYWNYTNLNDGQIEYVSNYPTGNQNCTLFFYGSNGSTDSWARFIIDLGEEKKIGQIRICIGGNDELSPAKSRTPKEISVYSVNNFIDGNSDNSTYLKNIAQRNNEGLNIVGKRDFTEIITKPTWIEYIKNDNSSYINSRYLLVEVAGYLENEDGAVINEIEIYDKYNNKINYNILNSLAFDATTNSYPYYWTDNRYWNYTNLNDGQIEYVSNYPTGNQNCTLFFYGSNGSTDSWARFIIDLGEEKKIGQIRICIGGNDELSPAKSRIPKEISVYSVNNFIDGNSNNSTYLKNIAQRNNEGLNIVGKREFTEIITKPTWIEYIKNDKSN